VKKRLPLLALVLALACATPARTPAPPTPVEPGARPAEVPAEARAAVEDAALGARLVAALAGSGAPGASACVVLADGTVLAVAEGLADREEGRALAPSDRMLAGSVGKTFFAAYALALVREEKLDLDAPIERWLGREPWFGRLPNAHAITPRMLLQHTSGLVRYEFDPRFAAELARDPARIWKPAEQLAFLFDTEAKFAAGAGWEYSDTNYIVLALVCEAITGTRCYDEIRRRFLEPLALADTVPSDARRIPRLAQGYVGAGDPLAPSGRMLVDGELVFNPQFEWAGGGYASTPRDLARWMRAVQHGEAYGKELLAMARSTVPAPMLGPTTGYGLGTIRWQTPHGVAYGHAGYFPGYRTEVRWYEGLDVCVAVMVNTSDGRALKRGPGRLCDELAATVAASAREPASAR
jgi:D-alanyl-D-alanine carboxypeptidase